MQDRTVELLNKYLNSDFEVYLIAPRKYSSDEIFKEIVKIEKKLKIKFPEEYVAHLLGDETGNWPGGGIYMEVNEEIWPRPKEYDVGPFWSFLYGMHTFTPVKESEDFKRLLTVGTDFIKRTKIRAVPILEIIHDADVYCVNKAGEIVQYKHEENIIEKVNLGFWELFERELKALKERKERKIEESKGV